MANEKWAWGLLWVIGVNSLVLVALATMVAFEYFTK